MLADDLDVKGEGQPDPGAIRGQHLRATFQREREAGEVRHGKADRPRSRPDVCRDLGVYRGEVTHLEAHGDEVRPHVGRLARHAPVKRLLGHLRPVHR